MKQLDTIAGQMKKTERSQQSRRYIGRRKEVEYETCVFCLFLASQDALEVMLVSELLTLRTKLTDVTLVSEDTY